METTIQSPIFKELKNYSKVAVLVDENTLEHCYPIIRDLLPENHYLIKISSGEDHKNLFTCQFIWKRLTDYNFNRKSVLINLGGGVIGDMGGFCAATFKRGMDFIQIPTTLLAQVDASTGGKLGIDFIGFKNHIGLFKEPKEVIIYPDFLKTLPERQLKSGFAEILKHCLIMDKDRWEELTSVEFSALDWHEIIPKSRKIKQDIVEKDPFEEGVRKLLNFGHTVGHALESYFLDTSKPFLHGEAVAIGMVAESYISFQKGILAEEELWEIKNYIDKVFGKLTISAQPAFSHLDKYLIQDKKNTSEQVNCTFLEAIGKATFDNPIDFSEVKEALAFCLKGKIKRKIIEE